MMVFVSLGLSPDLQNFDQIRSVARPTDVPDTGKLLYCVDIMWCACSRLVHSHMRVEFSKNEAN